MAKIKAIIFDLDHCIFNTLSLGEGILTPLIDILDHADFPDDKKKQVKDLLWTTSLADINLIVGFPPELMAKLENAYLNLEVPDDVTTYGDESAIKSLNCQKVLVTTGYRKFQQGKIDKTGVGPLFDEIVMDVLGENGIKRRDKKMIFEGLLKKNGWAKDEVLVVDDNPKSELGAARVLGIKTIQTLRPSVMPWPHADYQIRNLSELKGIIERL